MSIKARDIIKMMEKGYLKKLCLSGMFIAIGYVITAFLKIPYAGGAGYFNFGDIITLISSVILGPWYGALIGASFSSMADLSSGYGLFIPFTIIAKSLMAISAGYLYKIFPIRLKYFSFLIGTLVMVGVYFIAYWIYYDLGAYISSLFDLVQALVSSLLGYFLLLPLEKYLSKKHRDDKAVS